MRGVEQDGDLIERRKTWKTVSFGGITTYDAFRPGGKLLMGDVARIRGHKDALLRDDFDEICEQVWDDIFVCPNVSEMLDMYVSEVNALIDLVAIPHANIFRYRGSTTHLLQRVMQGFSIFPSADEFLRCFRSLAMIDSTGEISERLIRNDSRSFFTEKLKGKVELVPEDFKRYKRPLRKGGYKEEELFLPGWVRHRLSHPENEYERAFPDAGDYGRATYLLSAIILVLLYSRKEPLFG